LKIAILAKHGVVNTATWHFPDVICGHADPLHFAAELAIADTVFAEIDEVELAAVSGEAELCG
jgi:hypothetical protein